MTGRVLSNCRLTFGLLMLATLVYQAAWLWGSPGFKVSNLLSYFSVLSSLFGCVTLLVTSITMWRAEGFRWDWLRGAATVYVVYSGIVHMAFQSGYAAAGHTSPAEIGLILHVVMPVVLLLDWIIDPPTPPMTWRQVVGWMCMPAPYIVYTLVRGAIVGWYPHPLMDPSSSTGLAGAALVLGLGACLGAVLAVCVAAAGNIAFNLRKRRPPPTVS